MGRSTCLMELSVDAMVLVVVVVVKDEMEPRSKRLARFGDELAIGRIEDGLRARVIFLIEMDEELELGTVGGVIRFDVAGRLGLRAGGGTRGAGREGRGFGRGVDEMEGREEQVEGVGWRWNFLGEDGGIE